ncbi:hypothetical protein PVK06_027554 [Gossypium arboreum]|uniref:Transposase MuDR plant domain-containing protein n=1 Tax=Gossypium arboreum TaxID=29729 RepID=A0ABR0P369_GOSAR|nr:hypothetical protein PVK06_027554 [Gossypium arboreum]
MRSDIVICNDLDMSSVGPNAVLAYKFPEYLDIVPTHLMETDSEVGELFVGQQFDNKKDYVYAIKQYNIKLSVNYKVSKSTQTLYVGECWRADNCCNWWVRAALIQMT